MRRIKHKNGKRLGDEAKAKGNFFRKFLDKELILTGKIKAINNVLSTNFVGKSVLFGDLGIEDVDHIWIHADEFKNLDVENFDWSNPITIKGTVYQYTRYFKCKVWHTKYSLKDVTVL